MKVMVPLTCTMPICSLCREGWLRTRRPALSLDTNLRTWEKQRGDGDCERQEQRKERKKRQEVQQEKRKHDKLTVGDYMHQPTWSLLPSTGIETAKDEESRSSISSSSLFVLILISSSRSAGKYTVLIWGAYFCLFPQYGLQKQNTKFHEMMMNMPNTSFMHYLHLESFPITLLISYLLKYEY